MGIYHTYLDRNRFKSLRENILGDFIGGYIMDNQSANSVMCEYCIDMVKYSINTRVSMEEIDGIKFEFEEQYAICNECNNEIYVAELHDKNLYSYNEAYKKAKGIITIEEIQSIIDKYDIGKKPLSKILGWGENTVTRYLNGDFPKKDYSDKLKSIMESPYKLLDLLEENNSQISSKSYEKYRANIIKYINEQQLPIEDIAEYIVSEIDVTPKALQKILYYIQGFSVAFNNKFMFSNLPQAWQHGPVYRDIYNHYSNFKYNVIDTSEYNIELNINNNDKMLIDCVLKYFGRFNGDILEQTTHIESPWLNAREGLASNAPSSNPIDLDDIRQYFNNVKSKYNMINYSDIKQYIDDAVSKIQY